VIGLTEVNEFRVSTVFLGVNHGGMWFETMVFEGESFMDLACERYETLAEAKLGHDSMVARVQAGEISSRPGRY
jgi:hypothetical protein